MDILDIRLLKVITSDKVKGVEFAYNLDHTVFSPSCQRFAKMVVDFLKSFRSLPTRRTLTERYGEENEAIIDTYFDAIENLDYDLNEYSFDLEHAKIRYEYRVADEMKDLLEDSTDDRDNYNSPDVLKRIALKLQQVEVVKAGRSHTQKVVGEYLPEFENRYTAIQSDPSETIAIKTGYSLIDNLTGGLSPAELFMVGGETASGKALAIDTLIPTPQGWSKMGELKVGDVVFDDEGNQCNVIATSGIMYGHECYEIEFSDGAKIISDAGHLWETFTASERRQCLTLTDEWRENRKKNRPRIGKGLSHDTVIMNDNRVWEKQPPLPKARTTKEIFETLSLKERKDNRLNHSVRLAKPLKINEAILSIHPYVFGIWLGDGNSNSGHITTADQEIVNEFVKVGFNVEKKTPKYRWLVSGLHNKLNNLGLINNKHIPDNYLRSSFEQRLELAQGLMDSDGTVNKTSGCCEFTTTKKSIRDGFLELTRSLGILAFCRKGVAKLYGEEQGPKYTIAFMTDLPMFKLERKLKLQKRQNITKRHRMITAVRKADSVPVQCIQIDAKSSCFLCGREMIPTHNSQILMNMAIQMWLQGNDINTPDDMIVPGYNVLYFSLEMPYEDCFSRFMARMAAVPQRALSDAALDVDEYNRVQQASEFIRKYEKLGYYFGIVDVPRNVTIEEVELRYNDALLTYRPDIVVIDYMGLMHSRSFAKDQDFIRMGAIAESLHEFGRAYNVVVLTAHQLTDIRRNSQSQNEEDRKRVGVHRWGRSSLIMHNVNFGLQIESRPNERVYPDMKIHAVKNRKGPLGQGNLLKDFARATLLDVPMPNDIPDEGVQDVQEIIKRIQGGLQD